MLVQKTVSARLYRHVSRLQPAVQADAVVGFPVALLAVHAGVASALHERLAVADLMLVAERATAVPRLSGLHLSHYGIALLRDEGTAVEHQLAHALTASRLIDQAKNLLFPAV